MINQNEQLILITKDLAYSTFFTVIGYVCLDIYFAISLHFISVHNDPNAVAGLGLAFTTVNVLLIPMALGTNQSLNVHSAQALGANRPKLSQTFFNMTILLHLLYFLPIAAVILALKYPISLMIEEKDREATSNACQTYLYFLLPSSLFAILYEAVKSYMIAHKIFSVFMFIQVFTAGLHILWCYLFIDYLDLGGGIAGAGLAIILTEIINCILCFLVIQFTQYKDIFRNQNFSFSIQRQKKMFISYARASKPIVLHIYADYFVFFIINFIAAMFDTNQLNAQLALSNTANMYYKFPISMSLALMTYIGNAMGRRDVKVARLYAIVGVFLFLCFVGVSIFFLSIYKTQWAAFYSESLDIQAIILQTYPIFVYGYFIADGLQGTLSGVLKGIHLKEFVSNWTSFVFYVLGIPLELFFSCAWGLGLQVYGIWLAFMQLNIILSVMFIWKTISSDWIIQSNIINDKVDEQRSIKDSLSEDNQLIKESEMVIQSELTIHTSFKLKNNKDNFQNQN